MLREDIEGLYNCNHVDYSDHVTLTRMELGSPSQRGLGAV